jgi:RimJ/RimL family protein N-acetyltransferase
MDAPLIETDRLTLRPFRDNDVAPFVAALFSNPKVMKTLPQDPKTPDERTACAKHYIETYVSEWPVHGYGGWAVCARSDAIAPGEPLLGYCRFEEKGDRAFARLCVESRALPGGSIDSRSRWRQGFAAIKI